MGATTTAPRLEQGGVMFMVEVGFTERECLISKNALTHLRRLKGTQIDLLQTYHAFEDQIHNVARRLVIAGVSGSPLMIGTAYFV